MVKYSSGNTGSSVVHSSTPDRLVPDTHAYTHDGQRNVPRDRPDIRAQLTGSFTSARLSAFHAARHRVSMNRFSKRTGISTTSLACRDADKSGGVQSTRRTAAIASLNVG